MLQRCAPLTIALTNVRAVRDQPLCHIEGVFSRRPVEQRQTGTEPHSGIGTLFDEIFDDRDTVRLNGPEQRRLAFAVPGVDVGALFDEPSDFLEVIRRGCTHQRRIARVSPKVGVGAVVQEKLCHLGPARFTTRHQ